MKKWEIVGVKYIDMYHFQMFEAKFMDLDQFRNHYCPVYVYANISNFETESYEDSEVRVYAHSFEDLYCAEDYELSCSLSNDVLEYFKKEILESDTYRKSEHKTRS